jgi:hypothetical protein
MISPSRPLITVSLLDSLVLFLTSFCCSGDPLVCFCDRILGEQLLCGGGAKGWQQIQQHQQNNSKLSESQQPGGQRQRLLQSHNFPNPLPPITQGHCSFVQEATNTLLEFVWNAPFDDPKKTEVRGGGFLGGWGYRGVVSDRRLLCVGAVCVCHACVFNRDIFNRNKDPVVRPHACLPFEVSLQSAAKKGA